MNTTGKQQSRTNCLSKVKVTNSLKQKTGGTGTILLIWATNADQITVSNSVYIDK